MARYQAGYQVYVSAVRRLNAKIIQAEKTFGKGSATATRIKHQIASLIPSDALYYNKNGQIQIKRSLGLFEKYGTSYLNKAESVQSTRDYLKKAKESMLDFPSNWVTSNIPQSELVKRAEVMSKLEEFTETYIPLIYSLKDGRGQKAQEILRQKGRRTYEEMEKLFDIIDGGE